MVRSDDRLTSMRDSGIELLKILAICLIVIYHVVQTLSSENNTFIAYNDYIIDLTHASSNLSIFPLVLMSYWGVWGNSIFFICSAWFLLKSTKYNKQKWFHMLFEIWFISVSILVITLFIRKGDISVNLIIKSFFPTMFGNNWYITCYLLFYPIHPLLNLIIFKLDKKQLFRLAVASFVLYFCLCTIKHDWFYSNDLIRWIALYFIMAYIQLHCEKFSNNTKSNIGLFAIGLIGYIGMASLSVILGLRFSFMNNKILYWISNENPFMIAMSIAMFNIARNKSFKSKIINYISSLSLLIYVIHENLILRTYFRPAIWEYIHLNFGNTHVLLWVAILSVLVFTFGFSAAFIYDKTIRTLIRRVSNTIFTLVRSNYLKLEKRIIK